MPAAEPPWYRVADAANIPSPALLVYPERVERNLERMIALAGGAPRLRPHAKTHKMREVLVRLLALGVTRSKCATIAEAELAASVGVPDVLLAYPLTGPNLARWAALVRAFPGMRFSVTADSASAVEALSGVGRELAAPIDVLLDLDVGMHRTGVPPDDAALGLYRRLGELPGLAPGGLHAYDGQVGDTDVAARTAACDAAFAPVAALRGAIQSVGLPVPRVVAGGTPTLPIHAQRREVECSPGTCVFWDAGYARRFPDLGFAPAALVLARVVSKPAAGRLCLDLGHKAIASEMPHPRVEWLDLPEARAVGHNEEHLLIATPHADRFEVGACLYGIPWHICPTVALHAEAVAVVGGRAVGTWAVAARVRRLTV
jgi:D-serine deaminase-like pyridoxal phosphate-dependent protein